MSRATRGSLAIGTGLLYVIIYLAAMSDFSLGREMAWGMSTAGDWRELLFRQRSLMQFEGIAMITLGPVIYLFSPLNLAIAGLLGVLLALNVHGAVWLHTAPEACRLPGSRSGGLFAAFPALVAGGACCAPALLFLIGIPGLGAFAGLFAWLIPLSVIALLASRWWQRRLGAPAVFAPAAGRNPLSRQRP